MSKPLTYNIDLTDWLDREAERQKVQHGAAHELVTAAAEATLYFTDDELEEACSR